MTDAHRLPATVPFGFLGAGKTTLLNQVLNNREGRRVAVIVNDMSEVNIDAELVRAGAELSHTDETMVEMTNGCICCTLREDLLTEVRRLADSGRFDALTIESTGNSEHLPIAATVDFRDKSGAGLGDVARLGSMATVVDAANLLADYDSRDFLRDRGERRDAADERSLVELLVDQIEFRRRDDPQQGRRGGSKSKRPARQELVFIGTGFDEAKITAALDACLLRNPAGLTRDAIRRLPDPFSPQGSGDRGPLTWRTHAPSVAASIKID